MGERWGRRGMTILMNCGRRGLKTGSKRRKEGQTSSALGLGLSLGFSLGLGFGFGFGVGFRLRALA